MFFLYSVVYPTIYFIFAATLLCFRYSAIWVTIIDAMEAVNIDNLAKLITFSSYANANSDTNIDIVNPIPVSNATSIIDIHEAVSGFSAICSLVAIN